MLKQEIETVLRETEGKIKYIDQFTKICNLLGYTDEISKEISRTYGKRLKDKVDVFETQLRNKVGNELAEFVIDKIREDCGFMYWTYREPVQLV